MKLQVAAHEVKMGHFRIAHELRALIDEAKANSHPLLDARRAVPIAQPCCELSALLSVSYPKLRLPDMILDETVHDWLIRIIKGHWQIAKIRSFGLALRKKLLLVGPPGTGKTMSADVLAGELGLPLFSLSALTA